MNRSAAEDNLLGGTGGLGNFAAAGEQATAPFKWQVWHRYTVEVNFSRHHFIPACHHIISNLFVFTMDRIAGG